MFRGKVVATPTVPATGSFSGFSAKKYRENTVNSTMFSLH